ncbi:MAG: hypothetical protein EZS28_033793 [Streblomastix strix]|uniref:Uncharacterized protein n=1 Tax=Streblomastix strix TaxID=222440 RepID=A0A5J4UKZ1_9EUKA|nr:MAG: hypothetical protein EZS28_033793 [Streblomastix strix]
MYLIDIPTSQEEDEKASRIRRKSRQCLKSIQENGDEYGQALQIKIGFVEVLIKNISTAGGTGEIQYEEIESALYYIYKFIYDLHNGRNNPYPSFPPFPTLYKTCVERIEEEGGNEE